MKVRVGYGLGNIRPLDGERLGALAEGMERRGFDSLWLSERISGPAPDPVLGLTYAAARTKKIKLGTSVSVLPGRSPALVAKEWATLDVLSGGRALPAFGLGIVHPVEQQAFGVARGDRASIFDEALPLLRRLWSRGLRRPRRHVVPLHGHERAAEAGASARRVARRQGAVGAEAGRPAGRRLARVVRDARAVRDRAARHRRRGRRRRARDRPRALRRHGLLHARRAARRAASRSSRRATRTSTRATSSRAAGPRCASTASASSRSASRSWCSSRSRNPRTGTTSSRPARPRSSPSRPERYM